MHVSTYLSIYLCMYVACIATLGRTAGPRDTKFGSEVNLGWVTYDWAKKFQNFKQIFCYFMFFTNFGPFSCSTRNGGRVRKIIPSLKRSKMFLSGKPCFENIGQFFEFYRIFKESSLFAAFRQFPFFNCDIQETKLLKSAIYLGSSRNSWPSFKKPKRNMHIFDF